MNDGLNAFITVPENHVHKTAGTLISALDLAYINGIQSSERLINYTQDFMAKCLQ